MKKRFLALLLAIAVLAGMASAATVQSPRWTNFDICNSNIYMKNGVMVWSGDADTYPSSNVTLTKIEVKLQVATQVGWGTIETATYSAKNFTSAGGDYTNWHAGQSYRISVEAWAYEGKTMVENIGPYFDYVYP